MRAQNVANRFAPSGVAAFLDEYVKGRREIGIE
jgi:hypothetical protein